MAVSLKQVVILMSLLGMTMSIASCANSPFAQTVERSLAADPRLNPASGSPSPGISPSPDETTPQLPATFPEAIPRYAGATLMSVIPGSGDDPQLQRVTTRWQTSDRPQQVRDFYQAALSSNGWSQAQAETTEALTAQQPGLQVTVTIPTDAQPSSPTDTPAPGTVTEFTVTYVQGAIASLPSPFPSGSPSPSTAASNPPSSPVGMVASPTASPFPSNTTPQTFSDISEAPEELRSYLEDLAKLGIFVTSGDRPLSQALKPNTIITRREFALWLVAANNQIYRNRPAQKIRTGVSTSQPAFQDVSRADPDFAAIQGLAEAGLIPSSLSGDPTATNFRPDSPLTRENLLLWKVPMDIRRTLPNATVQAVQDTWGFQDAARIEPKALRAVLADFQNGDLSNIRRAFGYTTLFQPKKLVTRAEAAAVLWYFGSQGEGISAHDALQN